MTKIDHATQMVWYNPHGLGRNRFALFRRVFELERIPEKAAISLFADTAYQLFVNGRLAQIGPARFDRLHPCYDSVPLESWLRPGRNAICVRVKSFGCKTFKDNSRRGGFIAWGAFSDGGDGTVDLSTSDNGPWKARRCEAFSANAAKMSFALDAVDVFDAQREETGWEEIDFDDSAWNPAVVLEDQGARSALAPRELPYFDLSELPFQTQGPIDPLSCRESVIGFSVPTPDFHHREGLFAGRGKWAVAVATHVFSPRAQTVGAGLFWGEYFLNGKALEKGHGSDRLRKDFILELKEGWNAFYAKEEVIDDCFTFLMSIPRSAGLLFSSRRDSDGIKDFAYCGPLPIDEMQREEAPLEASVTGDDDYCGWRSAENQELCPGRRSLWDEYEPAFERVDASELESHCFALSRYPNGFSVLLDFGQMRLFLPEIEIDGAGGASVDLCYGEHLASDGRRIKQSPVYIAGDRFQPSAGQGRFLASQPRGARYLRITVRGAREDVRIKRLRFRCCQYPVERIGEFRCSDPTLEAVWAMCERTQRANMEDVFVDCSGRERGMYLRDVFIQFHNTLAGYGDTRLMGRCMELYGQSPGESGKFRCVYPTDGNYTIADFAIEAIDSYWQYFLASGDRERLEKDWEAMKGSMNWFHNLSDEREDGLLDADWPLRYGQESNYGGMHGDNKVSPELLDKTGPNAGLTFPYLLMLRRGAQIARLLGCHSEAAEFEERRLRIGRNARRLLWNEQLGCFNDNLQARTQSIQASLLAVYCEEASSSQEGSIQDWVARRLPSVFINGYSPDEGARFGPAYSFFVFGGLYRLGMEVVAERLIREGWGWMLAQGARTTPEFFEFDSSRCHAWSASPMYYLSRFALGVRFPDAPDFSVVEVDVRSGLDWAEGCFPIPGATQGVRVKWKRLSSGRIKAEVDAPHGVRVRGTAHMELT